MSRVGKNPVAIPSGVEVRLSDGVLIAKGKNGELNVDVMALVDVSINDNQVAVTPQNTTKRARQAWGSMRALINNAVIGVSEGFIKRIEIKGVGYRAQMQGSILKMQLGYSHDINFDVPSDVKIVMEGERNGIIAISGASKQRVGQIASEIRAFRPPEPYKGKGLRYTDEFIIRKEGKKK